MPEGPEVEGFRAYAQAHAVGRRIPRARALDDWMLKDVSPATFARRLKGLRITSASRIAKQLVLTAGDSGHGAPAIVLHYGMTGRPRAEADTGPLHRWDRMALHLDDGTRFVYANMRRLGSIRLLTRSELSTLGWQAGPDPSEAPRGWLAEVLATRTAPIKALLLDQSLMSGVGNIYADEALHAAGIAPTRRGHTLSYEECARLQAALRRILRTAYRANVRQVMAPMRSRVPRGRDEPCPDCGRGLVMSTVGGRSSYWCRSCQR
jgi:formamidopyrimidine-DNA glycosylase